MPSYTDISSKEWNALHELDYTPNVKRTLTNIRFYGRKAIVPAGEVLNCHSAINQVNKAFIRKGMPFRLRIVQSGYPSNRRYPNGCLVQLARKISGK